MYEKSLIYMQRGNFKLVFQFNEFRELAIGCTVSVCTVPVNVLDGFIHRPIIGCVVCAMYKLWSGDKSPLNQSHVTEDKFRGSA